MPASVKIAILVILAILAISRVLAFGLSLSLFVCDSPHDSPYCFILRALSGFSGPGMEHHVNDFDFCVISHVQGLIKWDSLERHRGFLFCVLAP